MKRDYGGWLFMYAIIAVSCYAAFIIMLFTCNILELALWAKCILISIFLIGCLCVFLAYRITHNKP